MASPDGLRSVLPTSAAESSSARDHPPYDVFLNHCGRDTKYTLANTIYNQLNCTGLRVFFDKDELKLGDFFPHVLRNAISSAPIHIAIISQNYAASHWCLDELECMLQTNAIIIPIFYYIDLAHVRWVKGNYEKAFSNYEEKKRYSEEKLKNWKSALYRVSHITGQIIHNQCDEEEVVMKVVTCVLQKLKKERLHVALHPVGIDEAERDFYNFACQFVDPIQIVGIWGMGGSGKTTLAKHIYNKKCSTIKRSSFLFDVREAASKEQLHEKQKMLLKELKLEVESADFDNIDKGKKILRSCLRSIPVLIILDDVDHIDQLHALLPAKDILGHGSMILPQDIKSKLKISYDALDEEEKQMFLDIACFFIGCPSNRAIATWDGSGWSGLHGWQRLVNKCLVELDIDDTIRMHDHLKDLGREIANKQSPYRLWSKKQIIEIQSQQRAIQIRGMADAFGEIDPWSGKINPEINPWNCYVGDGKIRLNTSQGELILALGSLGLKIFIGKGDFIDEQCSELSTQLLCFHCYTFRHTNIPTWLSMKNLRSLELRATMMCDLWECDEDAPLQLRHLAISECYLLPVKKINALQRLKALETIEIDACVQLKNHQKVVAYNSFRYTFLGNRVKLEKIKGLGGLKALEKLRLSQFPGVNRLSSLAGLTSLKSIDLSSFEHLEKVEGLECLTSLKTLSIENCTELKTLPRLSELTSLQEFSLKGCEKVQKVEGLEVLRSLKRVVVHMSGSMEKLKLPEQSERLKSVEIVAKRADLIEPSTRAMQKWAREEIICTMGVIDVGELLSSDYRLPEDVLHTYSSQYDYIVGLTLNMPESSDSAILMCFIIHSTRPNLSFDIYGPKNYDSYFDTVMNNVAEESIWVWMGIFPQQSDWLSSQKCSILLGKGGVEVEEGWLMRGTEQSIREVFHHLISHRYGV